MRSAGQNGNASMLKFSGFAVLAVLLIPVGIVAIYFGWWFIANNVIYPIYVRRAEAFNDQQYASGLADVVEVEHRVDVAGQSYSAVTAHACTERADTAPRDIKGGPHLWKGVRTYKAEAVEIKFNERVLYTADIGGDACDEIRKLARAHISAAGSPIDQVRTGAVLIRQGENVQKCKFPLWKGGSSYGGFRVYAPVIKAVKTVPTHQVFERSELPAKRKNSGPKLRDPILTSEYTVDSRYSCLLDRTQRGMDCIPPEKLDPTACTAQGAGLEL